MEVMLAETEGVQIVAESVSRLATGIDRIAKDNIDVVLLDLSLPDAAGIEAVVGIRAAAPSVPVVVLTGIDDEQLALSAMHSGAQDYLVKGDVDSRLLVRSIRYAIERTRTERELGEQRQRLAVLLESIPDRIYFKDREGRFLQVNPALAKYFGLAQAQEAIGKSDSDFFLEEHASQAMADERKIMQTGEPMVGMVEKETFPDGRIGWSLTTKMSLRDEHGATVGTFGLSRDITSLKLAEEALRISEDRYMRLLDSVTDYVYSVDLKDGQVISTSHGPGCLAVTGYSPEDFKNDPWLWHRIIHPEDRDSVTKNVMQTTGGGAALEIEHRIIRKDGAIRWVRNKHVPRYDPDGRLVSYDGLVSDITDRRLARDELLATNARLTKVLADLTKSHEDLKAAQSQLMQAEKLHSIGQLAAGVAHEVKNPLQVILVGLQYLNDCPLASEQSSKSVLDEMNEAVKRANVVVRDLLDFASPRELGMQERSINALIEQSLRFVAYEFNQSKIKVVRHLAKDLPDCRVDPTKIEQVFINLFTNAAHAMADGGTLTIRTCRHVLVADETTHSRGNRSGIRMWPGEQAIVVEIEDTGTGISEENLQKIFDPFFTTKNTGKGTGLGLSVTRKIIDLHGGQISIKNNPNGGAIVKLLLRTESRAPT
jgi:PAS domain S-box-containing protein